MMKTTTTMNEYFQPLLVCALASTLVLASVTPATAATLKYNPASNTLQATVANTKALELSLGKAKIIKLAYPVSRLSISNPNVVGLVLISPTEVQLIGKSIGVANLLLWNQSGQSYQTMDLSVHRDVSVLSSKIQEIAPAIKIVPMAADDTVILTGVADSEETAQLVYDIAKAYFETSSSTAAPAASGAAANSASGSAAPAAPSSSASTSSSFSQGSALTGQGSQHIINMIRIAGKPSTKAEMIQARLRDLDSHITLNVVPGFGAQEKAILSGRVKNASLVAKAVNLTSLFYGVPGIKVLAGPGGNTIPQNTSASSSSSSGSAFTAGQGGELIGNASNNVLHGQIVTDTSGNVVSMLEIAERPQVRCSVKIMEVRKVNGLTFNNSLRYYGEQARAATFGGTKGTAIVSDKTVKITTIPTFFGANVTGIEDAELGLKIGKELSALLSGLVTEGKARVLAEPTITSISGEPGSFLAGGEFPVPTSNVNGQVNVEFKQFGVRLNLLPTVTERGTIHMQVSPEVSSIDREAGVKVSGFDIPGLRTNRSQAVVEMHDGENFVMSGLFNQDMTDTLSKTPLLGQIPILGNLFRSKAFQNKESELVIVIHPEIQHGLDLSYEEPKSEAVSVAPHLEEASTVKKTVTLEKPLEAKISSEVVSPQKPSPALTETVSQVQTIWEKVKRELRESEMKTASAALPASLEKASVKMKLVVGKPQRAGLTHQKATILSESFFSEDPLPAKTLH
jgi:Flp pilus assembly secretin CpaC